MVHITIAATITVKNDDESKTEVITYDHSLDITEVEFQKPEHYDAIEIIGGELGPDQWQAIRTSTQTKVDTVLE